MLAIIYIVYKIEEDESYNCSRLEITFVFSRHFFRFALK